MILSTLYFAFNAVVPILLMIVLGYWARQRGILTEGFVKPANKFNFRFALMCMLFNNLYGLEGIRDIPIKMTIFAVCIMVLLTAMGFVVAHVFTQRRNRRGVLIQAVFRSNYAIIGIPIATALAGSAGAALASALQAPSIIYYNFASILCLSLYSDQENSIDVKKILYKIVTNPLIQGLALGVVVLGIREFIPRNADGTLVFSLKDSLPWLYTVITYLGRMATPLALVVLGAQFSFSAVKGMKKELIAGVTGRLVAAPIVGFLFAFMVNRFGLITLNPTIISVLISLFGSPTAVASVVMASEMGADEQLAGQLVVWTTLLSMVTVFIQICIFRFAGMI